MSRRLVIILVAITVWAIAIGALVSHFVTKSSDPALPTAGALAPVVGPADGELGPPLQISAPVPLPAPPPAQNGGNGSGNGSGNGASGGNGEVPTADPIALVQPYEEAAPPTTTTTSARHTKASTSADSGSGSGSGSASASGLGPFGIRFIDPCAVDGPRRCDDDGIRSTVLGLTAPPPFEITGVGTGSCAGVDPLLAETHLILSIRSTGPGRFVSSTARAASPTLNTTGGGTTTSAAERSRWEAADFETDVTTCLIAPLPNPADPTNDYIVTVRGRDDPAEAQEDTYVLHAHYIHRGRPPVRVDAGRYPFNEAAIATDIPGGPHAVPNVVLVAGAGHCDAAERAAAQPLTGGASVLSAELDAATYPFDRNYTQFFQPFFTKATDLASARQVPFETNGIYRLCVWWVDSRSSGADGIPLAVDHVEIQLQAPDRYRMDLRVKSVDFPRSRSFHLDIDAYGDCQIRLSGNAAHLQYLNSSIDAYADFNVNPSGDPADNRANYPNGPSSCDQGAALTPPLGLIYTAGDNIAYLPLYTTLDGGTRLVTDLQLPMSPCSSDRLCRYQDSFKEAYVVSLGTRRTGMCGSDFGDCTPPTESVGSVTIQIVFHHSTLYSGNPYTNGQKYWFGPGEY